MVVFASSSKRKTRLSTLKDRLHPVPDYQTEKLIKADKMLDLLYDIRKELIMQNAILDNIAKSVKSVKSVKKAPTRQSA